MKGVFPTDEHFPFQDDRAREVAMQIVQDFQPDLLITLSDGIDFYNISAFDKNPTRVATNLQKEIDAWVKGQLEWSSAAPSAKKKAVLGNHEDRLRRYLWRHPEIASLDELKFESLLKFDKLGIEWSGNDYGYDEILLHKRLLVKHGHLIRNKSAMSGYAELEKERFTTSVLTGHTHRGGVSYVSTRFGIQAAYEGFCLCKLDPEYTSNPNWQQGITLFEVNDNWLSVEPIPIHTNLFGKKLAIWRGKEYMA
jgi:predicted phosphodiesterase